ncbi:hypothetical protein [Pseudomonas citronellolis]|uniref:hypothetical protein n=1 Tax=Pseudomonas citronellolis TaxID=53408 RepID=UPI0023E38D4A|nr:hypothetical protein [Pseudomonas citronellolis]MDF3935328.1 hypothetical protein [Pseudomonas citronellolis]
MSNLATLNLQLAFSAWAQPRGYDLTASDDGSSYLSLETRSAWLGFEAAHGPDGVRLPGQQLYARIRKTSKYAHQTDKLFAVRVGKPPYDNFVVHGGPGGVYALRDVHFYVLVDGKPMKLT